MGGRSGQRRYQREFLEISAHRTFLAAPASLRKVPLLVRGPATRIQSSQFLQMGFLQSFCRLGAASWGLSANLFILVDETSENVGSQPCHLSGGTHPRVNVQASTRSKCVSLDFCTST